MIKKVESPDDTNYVQYLGYCHQLEFYLVRSHFGNYGYFETKDHETIYLVEPKLLANNHSLPYAIKIDFQKENIYVLRETMLSFEWELADHLTVEIYA
jgi:hypothetical protein